MRAVSRRAVAHLVIGAAASLASGIPPAGAQQGSVTVGAPGALARLVEHLAPAFSAQTGITLQVGTEDTAAALLVPQRLAPPGSGEAPFFGDAILVGSRADRARVRGLRDMKAAFRWIASARALYVSSSGELGLRDLELKLWEEAGVNVRTRLSWYIEASGGEMSVLRRARELGAYVLVQRVTWLAEEDRRGLEIVAQGDPALRGGFVSVLRKPSREAATWHEWLSSDHGQAAVAGWTLNGTQVFSPAAETGTPVAIPPRT